MQYVIRRSVNIIDFIGISSVREKPLLVAIFPTISNWYLFGTAIFGAVLVSFLAQLKFYLPGNPVPVTLQGFGVLVLGGVLGWKWGLVSILFYFISGLVGLPVFANENQGNLFINLDISEVVKGYNYVFMGVTGGYLLGFIVATVFIGFIIQSGWNRGATIWSMLLGSFLIYVPALIWLTVFDFGWPAEGELFTSAVYPFIPGDLLKVVLASMLISAAYSYLDRRK